MSFRCPNCKRDDALIVDVQVPAWRGVDTNLVWQTGRNNYDYEWSDAFETGMYSCGGCDWSGPKDALEELGIDGEPLPDIHRDQISIEEALSE